MGLFINPNPDDPPVLLQTSLFFPLHTANSSGVSRTERAAGSVGLQSCFFFSALLPGSTQIANSYLPPQARLRLQTVCLWLVFKLGCNIWRPGISIIIIINYRSSSSRGNNTWELRHREKYEKDIYWQNCPQKPEKWLQTSETKVRRAGAGEEVVETSAPWKIHWIHFWLMPIDSHQEIMAIKKLFKT